MSWVVFKSWVNFFFTAKRGGHGVHSPLIFNWIQQAKSAETPRICFPEFGKVDPSPFGAGSKGEKTVLAKRYFRRIGLGRKYARVFSAFLNQVVRDDSVVWELGTGSGYSAQIFDQNSSVKSLISVDADPRFTPEIKKQLSKKSQLINTDFHTFFAQEKGVFDLLFIDGDHRKKSVLEYFEAALSHANSFGAWVVLDDIRWSTGMLEAWNQIRERPEVQISVDSGRMGWCYLGPRRQKEHFVVQFA